ncbi:hypothetical protein Btru_027810 [Bulinus truncatus]|nr:hypothetical protein Btru_027810 [Bulinus truncatus]
MGSGSSNQISSTNLNARHSNPQLSMHIPETISLKSEKLTQLNLNKNSNISSKNIENKSPEKDLTSVASQISVIDLTNHVTPVTSLAVASNSSGSIAKEDSLSVTNELHSKANKLEQELAKAESEKLDLHDQMQMLEERCKLLESRWPPHENQQQNSLQETLQLKDLYIAKLEKDLQKTSEDFTKVQSKMKKQMKIFRKQIQELRQEASIKKLEMSLDMIPTSNLNDLRNRGSALDGCEVQPGESSHSKVIVELSNQLSEQSELIAKLEREVAEKDSQMKKLKDKVSPDSSMTRVASDKRNKAPSLANPSDQITRTDSIYQGNNTVQSKASRQITAVLQKNAEVNKTRPFDDRPPTSLSDSDSDWEDETFLSEKRIHSAMSTTGSAKQDLAVKPASAGVTSDLKGKPQKKTFLQRRVEKQTNSHFAFPHLAYGQQSDSVHYLDSKKNPSYSQKTMASIDNEMFLLNLKT